MASWRVLSAGSTALAGLSCSSRASAAVTPCQTQQTDYSRRKIFPTHEVNFRETVGRCVASATPCRGHSYDCQGKASRTSRGNFTKLQWEKDIPLSAKSRGAELRMDTGPTIISVCAPALKCPLPPSLSDGRRPISPPLMGRLGSSALGRDGTGLAGNRGGREAQLLHVPAPRRRARRFCGWKMHWLVRPRFFRMEGRSAVQKSGQSSRDRASISVPRSHASLRAPLRPCTRLWMTILGIRTQRCLKRTGVLRRPVPRIHRTLLPDST